jgi:hypothetical protein
MNFPSQINISINKFGSLAYLLNSLPYIKVILKFILKKQRPDITGNNRTVDSEKIKIGRINSHNTKRFSLLNKQMEVTYIACRSLT